MSRGKVVQRRDESSISGMVENEGKKDKEEEEWTVFHTRVDNLKGMLVFYVVG